LSEKEWEDCYKRESESRKSPESPKDEVPVDKSIISIWVKKSGKIVTRGVRKVRKTKCRGMKY